MQENEIIVNQIEEEYDVVDLAEENPEVIQKETVDIIEVENVEMFTVDSDEAFGALGEPNEQLRHQLLNGRDVPDQHPISAITGLKERLNDIEALDVVYSDEKNQADYYLWEDENVLQEDRVGYFVSICADTNKVKLCTQSDDIFGVSVDTAGFIGGQSEHKRDCKYGLIVHSGIVAIRCEANVTVGDYVVSNNDGFARKSDAYGYKVVELQNINGVTYAIIPLDVPMNQVNEIMDEFNAFDKRVGKVETNIISAINMANEAYSKSDKAHEVSVDAVKKALEALNKSNETADRTNDIETDVSNAKEIAQQAKAIADSTATSAETASQKAIDTSNEALTNVNELIKDLEPITTWKDTESENVGAGYLATYIKEGLATKVEVETVETLTESNKTAIEKNAEGIQTMVSSVDKYSVGEYSQAYGLTREQAKSILKPGYVYIPTKHSEDKQWHSEQFLDDGETNDFIPKYYYVWTGEDWESSPSPWVAFYSEEPIPSEGLKYWYIDSNEASGGYEPHSLYVWEDGGWIKVNILEGNVTNRVVSMVKQTQDEIKLEVTNARGNMASLGERIDANEASIQSVTKWSQGESDSGEEIYNLATIKQSSGDTGSNITLAVIDSDGERIPLSGAKIVLGTGDKKSFISLDADQIALEGVVTANGKFQIDTDGSMSATGGEIGGWQILDSGIYKRVLHDVDNDGNNDREYEVMILSPTTISGVGSDVFVFRDRYGLGASDYTDNFSVRFDGSIHSIKGDIGGWRIETSGLYKEVTEGTHRYEIKMLAPTTSGGAGSDVLVFRDVDVSTGNYKDNFSVNFAGCLTAQNAIIEGDSVFSGTVYANGGSFAGEITATEGTIGGWTIDSNSISTSTITGGHEYEIRLANNTPYGLATQVLYFRDWTLDENNEKTSTYQDNFSVNFAGHLTAKNATIEGELKAGSWLGSGFKIVDEGWAYSSPGLIIGSQDPNESWVSLEKEYLNAGYQGDTAESARWYAVVFAANEWDNGSDKRLKNTITDFDESYETFFDFLHPVTFKYNKGKSGRTHSGFIAQEVVSALEKANLSTMDFAGPCLLNYGTDHEGYWWLRRDQFVALNTWQIQKAKARITELEEKVAELETLIKGE